MFKNQLLPITYLLILIGTVFISTASLFEAQTNFDNQYFFLQKQLIWLLVSSISCLIVSNINLKIFKKISPLLYIISIVALSLVYLPQFGHKVFGARRWLNLGPLRFQPTELFKLSSLLFFSSLFSNKQKANLKNLSFYALIPLILILLEPDLSSTFLVASIIFAIYFFSQSNIKDTIIISSLTIVTLIVSIISSPYRLARFKQNYHSQQLTISLASGTLFGKGIGNSVQKYSFVPQISTDSILAIIGEELGFFGIVLLLFLFYTLIKIILNISKKCSNEFQKLFTIGLSSWIFLQSAINISAVSGLIPLTGISLPFISYGGSSLLSLMTAIGIVENIRKQTVK